MKSRSGPCWFCGDLAVELVMVENLYICHCHGCGHKLTATSWQAIIVKVLEQLELWRHVATT